MRFPDIPRTGLHLRDIFKQAFDSNPREARMEIAGETDPTPVEQMLFRSPALDLYRQYAPQWAGGYGENRMKALDSLLKREPSRQVDTLRVGSYPDIPAAEGLGGRLLQRGSQAAGALTGDFMTQGALNIWWFLNAVEAATMAAGQQAMHGVLGGRERVGKIPLGPLSRGAVSQHAPTGTPLHGARMVAATMPLMMAAGAATGTLFRQPGYKAVLPDPEDPTQSTDPLGEVIMRAIGRKGELLKYDDFVKERPDVSPGEYEAYKAYLYGNNLPLKATMEGIHGPEVNFLGKSVPLLTGVLPIVGGIIGARKGLRMAGRRVAGVDGQLERIPGRTDQFETLNTMEARKDALYGSYRQARPEEKRQARADYEQGKKEWAEQRKLVNTQLLEGALLGGSLGLGVTGAGAALLEQVRRGNFSRPETPEQPA